MTRINFFHGADDRLHAIAAWVARTAEKGHRIAVYVPAKDDLERLDRLLWSQPPTGFLPHCAGDSPLAASTPVTLTSQPDGAAHDEYLVNLSNEIPPGFARFHHLVEIVSTSEADKVPGRERFRFYRERGYPLDAQDIGGGLA